MQRGNLLHLVELKVLSMRKSKNSIPPKPKLRSNPIRFKASEWLRRNKDEPFTIPMLTEYLGYNPDSRKDTNKVYQDVILYWRKKALEYYDILKKYGFLDNVNHYLAWDIFLYNFNMSDAYVFLFDDERGSYIQPDMMKLERMDRSRIKKQWDGILTIMDEMKETDALFLTDGIQLPVDELEQAGKHFDNLLDSKKKEEYE